MVYQVSLELGDPQAIPEPGDHLTEPLEQSDSLEQQDPQVVPLANLA